MRLPMSQDAARTSVGVTGASFGHAWERDSEKGGFGDMQAFVSVQSRVCRWLVQALQASHVHCETQVDGGVVPSVAWLDLTVGTASYQ